jgi:hypothetical protein
MLRLMVVVQYVRWSPILLMPNRILLHSAQRIVPTCIASLTLLAVMVAVPCVSLAQQATTLSGEVQPTGTPASWVAASNKNELAIVRSQGDIPLRYLQRKIDARGDTTREIIESSEGNVARLLQRNGEPITPAEDKAERERLEANLDHPEDVARHRKRSDEVRDEALELIPLLPQAMLYNFAPGQPQPKGATSPQIVLDFEPNPAFHPPSLLAESLTGMAGRVWIDRNSRCITRIDAKILHPVNFGFGILAKLYPGGTIEFEQSQVNEKRWVYSRLEEHLTARVLMVRTLPQNTTITSWQFRPMPSPMSYKDAVRDLLAMPVVLQ